MSVVRRKEGRRVKAGNGMSAVGRGLDAQDESLYGRASPWDGRTACYRGISSVSASFQQTRPLSVGVSDGAGFAVHGCATLVANMAGHFRLPRLKWSN